MDGTKIAIIGGIGIAGYFVWRYYQANAQGVPYDPFGPSGVPSQYYLPSGGAQSAYQRLSNGYPTTGPGNAPAMPAQPAGPGKGAQLASGVATGAASTAATVATTGLTLATGALTFGIGAGAAVLGWAIADKGLFRGGEEGVKVNPARDQFLSQFGPGGTDAASGFGKLAAMLTTITGEPDGSHYFKALITAHNMDDFSRATREIQAVLATRGLRVAA